MTQIPCAFCHTPFDYEFGAGVLESCECGKNTSADCLMGEIRTLKRHIVEVLEITAGAIDFYESRHGYRHLDDPDDELPRIIADEGATARIAGYKLEPYIEEYLCDEDPLADELPPRNGSAGFYGRMAARASIRCNKLRDALVLIAEVCRRGGPGYAAIEARRIAEMALTEDPPNSPVRKTPH